MNLQKTLQLLCVFLAFSISSGAHAQSTEATEKAVASPDITARPRPKVALVLSGGGARGFAHIGVLRVLKEMRIPVDMVLGTSMGAVVGGAYAAGRSVEDLEDIVRTTSWDSVLADRPARDALDFRRREEDILLPSRIEFAVTKSGITFPPSAAGNAALEQALMRLLPRGMQNKRVNHLKIPFRSVASDLVTGEMVELNETPLFLTMRASLAVPGMFAPVHIAKRLVVDGGLVRNLPIDMARKMGADIIIAVNVGTPLAEEKELGSAISVAQQMLQILTEQNVQRSLKELTTKDILIAPNLNGINFLDFDEHHNAMLAGDIATRQLQEKLNHLSVSEKEYRRFETERLDVDITPDKSLRIVEITIKGSQHINPDILIKQSGLTVGEITSEQSIRQANTKLYGRGDLDHVETEIIDDDNQRQVIIKTHEALWSRNRLRLGLELSSDFKDDHQFSLSAMHVAASLNNWGGELRFTGKIGSKPEAGVQLFQPLGAGSAWYMSPYIQYNASSVNLFDNGRKQSRFGFKSTGAAFVLGHHFANWGEIEMGITRQRAEYKSEIPEIPMVAGTEYDTSQFVQFRLDTLDSLAFPTRGNLFIAQWERSLNSSTSKKSLINSQISGLSAFQTGDWAGHIYGEWARSQGNIAQLSLGGFLRLSGTHSNSLNAKTVALTRLVVAHRFASMPAALGGAIRLGFSAELGGGFAEGEAVKFSKIKRSGSAFIAFDTRFGPLYFGAGATKGGNSTFYLFLGPIW